MAVCVCAERCHRCVIAACAGCLSVFMPLLFLDAVVVKSLQVFSFLLDESGSGAGICFDSDGTSKDARMCILFCVARFFHLPFLSL